MRDGVVADTHGSLPPSIDSALAGVDRIVHAGDVGGQRVLDRLEAIAPVVAVRGNMDADDLGWRLPERAVVRAGEKRILVGHIRETLIANGVPESIDVIVTGHTHRASIKQSGDVLFVNPGSTGSRGRDGRGPTAAIIDLSVEPPEAWIVDL